MGAVCTAAAAEPHPDLGERARRSMCVYADLANRVVDAAWVACEKPRNVRALVVAAQPWEAWVTRLKVLRQDSRMEALMLQHAACMGSLRELDAGAAWPDARPLPSVSAYVHAFQRQNQLAALSLTMRHIDEHVMVKLCVGFTGLSHLRRMDMKGNELRAGGAAGLAAGLAHTPLLAVLRLIDTKLDGAAMRALAPAFVHISQLQELILNDNPLGADGAAALAEALGSTPSLTGLRLCSTSLNDAAISVLAPALSRMSYMRTLDLSWNPVITAGGTSLVSALRHVPTLRELHVWHSRLDEPTSAAIRAVLPPGCRVMLVAGTWETIA